MAEVRYELDLTVRAEAAASAPTALFTAEPMRIVEDLGSVPGNVFEERGPLFVDRTGGEVVYERSVSMSASYGDTPRRLGFAFVVAANTPWTVELRLDLKDAEGGEAPLTLMRGEGVTVFTDYTRTPALLPDGALVDEISLDAAVPTPGWTHVQHEYDMLQPTGVREYDIFLPGDFVVQDAGYKVGYYALFGSASGSGWVDYCGTAHTEPGDIASRMSYVQAQSRFEVAAIHLSTPDGSGDTLAPPLQELAYCGANWPFHHPLDRLRDAPASRTRDLGGGVTETVTLFT